MTPETVLSLEGHADEVISSDVHDPNGGTLTSTLGHCDAETFSVCT